MAKIEETEDAIVDGTVFVIAGIGDFLGRYFEIAMVAGMDHHIGTRFGIDEAVSLGNAEPVNIGAHALEELPDLQGAFLGADGHHLMEGAFDFDAPADEGSGHPTGEVMPFQDEDFFAFVCQS